MEVANCSQNQISYTLVLNVKSFEIQLIKLVEYSYIDDTQERFYDLFSCVKTNYEAYRYRVERRKRKHRK